VAFRYTSLASIVSALALVPFTVLFGYPDVVIGFCAFTAAAVILLHRSNVRRLRAGTENRFRGLRRAARA
jgi:glycerol-3-phosphate acyltransferase PlsY